MGNVNYSEGKPEMDAQEEVAAIETVAAALEPLDADARQRILDWTHKRYLKPSYDMLTKERRDAASALVDLHAALYELTKGFTGVTVEDVLSGMGELKRLAAERQEREAAEGLAGPASR